MNLSKSVVSEVLFNHLHKYSKIVRLNVSCAQLPHSLENMIGTTSPAGPATGTDSLGYYKEKDCHIIWMPCVFLSTQATTSVWLEMVDVPITAMIWRLATTAPVLLDTAWRWTRKPVKVRRWSLPFQIWSQSVLGVDHDQVSICQLLSPNLHLNIVFLHLQTLMNVLSQTLAVRSASTCLAATSATVMVATWLILQPKHARLSQVMLERKHNPEYLLP